MMPGPARSRPGTGGDASDDAKISATMTTKDPTTTAGDSGDIYISDDILKALLTI